MQLGIHATGAVEPARRGPLANAAGGGNDATRGHDALSWSDRRTVRLSESDTDSLTILHTDLTTKAVKNILFGTNSIGLLDKVDKTTLLNRLI